MADGTGAAVVFVCHDTLTEIGFGSAVAFIRQQEGIMGVEMSVLTSLVQVSILAMFLIHCVTSLPILGRYLGEEDGILRTAIFSPWDDADMFVAERDGRSELQTRQLGDIEFTNRHAELLKSKAKITSICASLKRMQSSKKSGVGGDSDRLISLLRQSCPNMYQ